MKNENNRNIGLPSRVISLAFWLALSAIVAAVGASFETGAWYQQIAKPDWTPPGWIFGPVWTFLYIAMAVAAWLVWQSGGWAENRFALTAYLIQLVLNAAWSWIFFGEHAIGLALADIILLLLLIIVVMIAFWKKNLVAGLLMLPYVLWVGFASVLNYSIWMLH